MSATNQFIGLDLTSSPKKPSAYAALDAKLRIIALGFLSRDSEIIALIDRIQPLVVTIDAPLSLPQGLCCLEESCSCQQVSPGKGRTCERELRARYGIMSYYTSKKSIIKVMVKRAIALKSEICRHGYQVIEIYPYATKVRLWGKDIPKKTTPAGLEFLRGRLTTLIPGLEREKVKNHDLCDALIAAYTGYLYSQGKAQPLGDPVEGQIFIPIVQH